MNGATPSDEHGIAPADPLYSEIEPVTTEPGPHTAPEDELSYDPSRRLPTVPYDRLANSSNGNNLRSGSGIISPAANAYEPLVRPGDYNVINADNGVASGTGGENPPTDSVIASDISPPSFSRLESFTRELPPVPSEYVNLNIPDYYNIDSGNNGVAGGTISEEPEIHSESLSCDGPLSESETVV